jgi:hypothetical protein
MCGWHEASAAAAAVTAAAMLLLASPPVFAMIAEKEGRGCGAADGARISDSWWAKKLCSSEVEQSSAQGEVSQ